MMRATRLVGALAVALAVLLGAQIASAQAGVIVRTKDGAAVATERIRVETNVGTAQVLFVNSFVEIDNQNALRLREASINGTNFVALRAPALLGSDVTLTLPPNAGGANQALTTDGAGNLSWSSIVLGVTAAAPLSSSGGTSPNISLTGVVGVANGGTGLAATGAAGNYLRSDGTNWSSSAILAGDLPAGSGNYIQNQIAGAQAAGYWISGTGRVGGAMTLDTTLAVAGATTMSSTLAVTGATTMSSTLDVSGATSLASTLGVTGATTLSSNVAVGDGAGIDRLSFNGASGVLQVGAFTPLPAAAGDLRYSGGSLLYYDGVAWQTLATAGGGTAFSAITTGINSSAIMTVNTGAQLIPSGTGVIRATEFQGTGSTTNAVDLATAEVSGTLAVTNGGTGTATAFIPGSVVFAGAGGVYAQDNANFFWDDTNNRLGIGTASPSYRLEASGTSSVVHIIGGSGAVNANLLVIDDNVGSADQVTIRNTGGGGTGVAELRLDANGPFGNKAAYLTYQVNGADKWTLAQDIGSGGNQGFSIAEGAQILGNARLFIAVGGNVGIGMTAPTTTLDVGGGGVVNALTGYRVAGAAALGNYLRGNGTNFVSSAIAAGDLPAGSGNYIQNQLIAAQAANSWISGTDRAATYQAGAGSAVAPSISFTGDTNTGFFGTGLDVLAASTAGVERMRIDSLGNVGIGTAAPAVRLQVTGGNTRTQILEPAASGIYTLGSAALLWSQLYVNDIVGQAAGNSLNNPADFVLAYTSLGTASLTTSGNTVYINCSQYVNMGVGYIIFRVLRDGVAIGAQASEGDLDAADHTVPLMWVDTPAAGLHTYTLQYNSNAAPIFYERCMQVIEIKP